jgi:DNA (cytosine-5)-methyltransferase 1
MLTLEVRSEARSPGIGSGAQPALEGRRRPRRREVAHALTGVGFDASEDGTGRGTPMIVQESQTGVRQYEDSGSLRANAPGTQPTGQLVIAAPLTHGSFDKSHTPGRRREDDVNLVAFGTSSLDTAREDGLAPPLMVKQNGQRTGAGPTVYAAVADQSVRRLTPTECARLMAFPDRWACPCDAPECVCPDGPQYAAYGNSVVVNVCEWIVRNLLAAA